MVRRLVRLALRRYRRNGLGAVSVPRLTDAVRAAIGWDVPESWILDAARGCPDNLGVLTRRGVPHCVLDREWGRDRLPSREFEAEEGEGKEDDGTDIVIPPGAAGGLLAGGLLREGD